MLRATGHARMVNHVTSKKSFSPITPNSAGLHFYPTICGVIRNQRRKIRRIQFVGLQPTVIASRASPPLLEQSSDSKNRGRASPVKIQSSKYEKNDC